MARFGGLESSRRKTHFIGNPRDLHFLRSLESSVRGKQSREDSKIVIATISINATRIRGSPHPHIPPDNPREARSAGPCRGPSPRCTLPSKSGFRDSIGEFPLHRVRRLRFPFISFFGASSKSWAEKLARSIKTSRPHRDCIVAALLQTWPLILGGRECCGGLNRRS